MISEWARQIFSARGVPVRIREIIEKECASRRILIEDVLNEKKFKELIACRLVIYRILRSEMRENGEHKFSYRQIGKWFGRDRTTVRNAVTDRATRRRENRYIHYQR